MFIIRIVLYKLCPIWCIDLTITVFTFLASLQCEYYHFVSELLDSQSNAEIRQRIGRAFTQLTQGVSLSGALQDKTNFRNNFEEFIAEIRGFLHVK